jgi:hypothetical protein
MGNIRNVKQLKAQQQRLKQREKELEELIDTAWKDTVHGFRPSTVLKNGAVSLLHKILKKWLPMK